VDRVLSLVCLKENTGVSCSVVVIPLIPHVAEGSLRCLAALIVVLGISLVVGCREERLWRQTIVFHPMCTVPRVCCFQAFQRWNMQGVAGCFGTLRGDVGIMRDWPAPSGGDVAAVVHLLFSHVRKAGAMGSPTCGRLSWR